MMHKRFCPAKINLFLEVTGKRPNGYHELATLFAKIDLGDHLTLQAEEAENTQISLELSGPRAAHIPAGPQNLVCKAAQAFLDEFALRAHIRIKLEKNVPTGAGLGGGSSDAAGVLLCLCEQFGKNPADLLPLAARLGADVPLFMRPETFLKGAGIGEQLTPVLPGDSLPALVLVYPQTAVSTREVFARLTLPPQKEILTNISKLDKLIEAVKDGMPAEACRPLLFNRLEEYVFPSVPSVRRAFEALKAASGGICSMSGSGSTVFALVGTNLDAWNITKQLAYLGMSVYPVSFYRGQTHANHGSENSSNE